MAIPKLKGHAKVTVIDSAGKKILTSLTKTDWSGDSHLPKIITELEITSEEMNRAISQTSAESTLDDKDVNRDNCTRGAWYMLNGLMYDNSPATRESAGVVMGEFSKYGISMVGESYDVQSSMSNSLLKDFAEPTIAEAIAKLPTFSPLADAMRVSQDEFEIADQEWNSAKSGTGKSATEVKKELLAVINTKLIPYLRVVSVLDSETFGTLSDEVAEFITTTNRAV